MPRARAARRRARSAPDPRASACTGPSRCPDRRARTARWHRRRRTARYSTRRMLPTRAEMSFGCRSSVSRSSSSCDDAERAAHHLAARVRPRRSLGLDRVSRLRPAVGPVHDAHEVRGRSHQPELDRPIVQRLHAHPVRVRVVSQVVVLAVLEHEVDRHRGPGRHGIEDALDAELDVARRERRPVGPHQPLAEMEHVPQAVVGDLPSVGERRHDRALGPLLDEPIEQLHAELDVGPRDRRPGVVIPRAVARRDLDRRRRSPGTAREATRTRTRAGTSRSPP